MKLCLMVSGRLGFQVLEYCLKIHRPIAVLTDKNSTDVIRLSEVMKLPCFIGNPRKGRTQGFRKGLEVDLLLSINYLYIVENDIISWPRLGAINFHGSLLPKYRGRTPHVWAIINNESITGVTAHLMTIECDEGDIVDQVQMEIGVNDTGADILNKYGEIYPAMVSRVIDSFELGKVEFRKQDSMKATYFNKRSAEDGRIDWSWQRERIRNWVRAQALPYPGAFALIDNEKVIIDKVEFDDWGFHQNLPNGLIMNINPIIVKTSNGALRITEIRQGMENLTIGGILE